MIPEGEAPRGGGAPKLVGVKARSWDMWLFIAVLLGWSVIALILWAPNLADISVR